MTHLDFTIGKLIRIQRQLEQVQTDTQQWHTQHRESLTDDQRRSAVVALNMIRLSLKAAKAASSNLGELATGTPEDSTE